jgi:4-amino-4-deoxy-L-arabinose transferase-like glycosyltransferase
MHWFPENYRVIVVSLCSLASISLALYFLLNSAKRPWRRLYGIGFLLISIGCLLLFIDLLLGFMGGVALLRKGFTVTLCFVGVFMTVLGERRKRQRSRLTSAGDT